MSNWTRSNLLVLALALGVTLFIPDVSAAFSLSSTTLDFGSSSQVKVGANQIAIVLPKTTTLSTTTDYTNVQLIKNEAGNAQGAISVPSLPSSLNALVQIPLTINVTIPGDFDAVDDDLEESGFNIGTITIQGINGATQAAEQITLSMTLQVKNQVALDRLEIERESGTSDITSSSTVDVDAGQHIEFISHIKNKFQNATYMKISSVDISIDIEDIDDDSATLSNLDPEEIKEKGIDFNIDEDEEGKVDVVMRIGAIDELGGRHGLVHEFKIDIKEAQQEPEDDDADGVPNTRDECPITPSYCTVNVRGCPLDKDKDGICDAIDNIDNSLIIPSQQQSQENAIEKQVPKKTNSTSETQATKKKTDDASAYFLPFFIGFVAGGLIASGFFFLLRS